MLAVQEIFERLHKLTHEEGQSDFITVLLKNITSNENTNQSRDGQSNSTFQQHKHFLQKIYKEIDDLSGVIANDDTILISVKNQKQLRTCFQLITSLGVSLCLIPGLGIHLSKRCASAAILPPLSLNDEEKYEILTTCVDFFTRSYKVPVLKNIIITFHLCDYLSALIQLSFAPLKKPGVYNNFTMTQERYDQLNIDRKKYIQVFDSLVNNCFQPILMKELLVIQSVTNPSPPLFVKRVIANQMSQRLLVPGGLLSLIRCFIETYDIDTGFEWKKIETICRIVAAKHGTGSQDDYLKNICSQLKQILKLNNTHYLATAVACVLCLNERYQLSKPVKDLVREIFQSFDYDTLMSQPNTPGTIILSPQEIEQKVNILHACVCTNRLEWPITLLSPNLYIMFLLGVSCTRNDNTEMKLKDTLLKCLEQLNKNEIYDLMKKFLYGEKYSRMPNIVIDEFEAGLAIKSVATNIEHPKNEAMTYFLKLFKASTDNGYVQSVFEASLLILIDLNGKRLNRSSEKILISEDDLLLNEIDEQYANILQLLAEISTSPKVVSALKRNPSIVLHFIEYFILKTQSNSNEECITIALVLLNTILSNSNRTEVLEKQFADLIPVLKVMADNDIDFNNILCKEALSLISSDELQKDKTPCGKAISNIFDNLLPVRAHGIIELTKLIESKDSESISKKHYIFCIFQDQLKDPDSYVYLSAINGIAALGAHCTEDVLQVICNEFLQVSCELSGKTKDEYNKITETRMKVGEVIVKVMKRLGEMAITHKSLLLNTMLCGCRDEEPLIRASALSNLAEICLHLYYKIGSIVYEVLLCLWSILETDKAIECRRASVMVISSLLKGLGKETLVQLKENILPIYRTLKSLYRDPNEDSVVRLHAQIALEELNETVTSFMFPELKMEKQIFVIDKPDDVFK